MNWSASNGSTSSSVFIFSPSVAVRTLSAPNPVRAADGRTHLAYELLVVNPSNLFITLEKVEAVDPLTVRITTSEPYPVLPTNMVNLPVRPYTRGPEIRDLIEANWMPRLEAFEPQMIFISAGFDAHREDELGQLGLVEADYTWITQRVKDVADRHAQGRIVSCLEGGYNLGALARSVASHLRVLAEV